MVKAFVNSICLVALSGLCAPAHAQAVTDTARKAVPQYVKPIKKPKPISKEFSFGARLNSDGWGIFVNRGASRSDVKESELFYNLRYWEVEFDEKKNIKEIKRTNKTSSPNDTKPRAFIFGKTNNFYTFKLGYGYRKMIAGKPDPGTVSIHWFYGGGLSLGMLKPYYVDLYTGESVRYTDTTKEQFLDNQAIVGSSGFGKGLNEMKFVPGLHAKTGLHFDFAASKKTVLAIEFGVNAEIYTKKIQLMANQKDVPYFVNAFASFQFGKRW